jgi:lauroyl/myristoyl acyltransferase
MTDDAWRGAKGGVSIAMADLVRIASLLIMGLLSWLWPFERLGWLARNLRALKGGTAVFAGRPAYRVPPPHIANRCEELGDRLLETQMQVLALYRPRQHPRLNIRWDGLEHLEAALARKKGAILWESDFVYSSLIAKMALERVGFRLTQLARRGHGRFSYTPFGIRYLNPQWTRIEDRFIRERVIISDERTLQHLGERLEDNQVVNITFWKLGRRTVENAFLGGKIRIASGPVHLARISGAPLLPSFTIRGEDGGYDIKIGPPLEIAATGEFDYGGVVGAYLKRLEPLVDQHPDQWLGWTNFESALSWDQREPKR